MITLDFILSIIAILLFLTGLWFAIYITWGTDLSGTNPSAVGTTTMIFIMVLITILLISGVIWFILNALSFI